MCSLLCLTMHSFCLSLAAEQEVVAAIMGPSRRWQARAIGRAVWTCQHCITHVLMQSQMHKRIAGAALRDRPGTASIQLELSSCVGSSRRDSGTGQLGTATISSQARHEYQQIQHVVSLHQVYPRDRDVAGTRSQCRVALGRILHLVLRSRESGSFVSSSSALLCRQHRSCVRSLSKFHYTYTASLAGYSSM
ncbi:hypothetical protein V8E51_011264 [Hyaloscypha variabilis]